MILGKAMANWRAHAMSKRGSLIHLAWCCYVKICTSLSDLQVLKKCSQISGFLYVIS